LNEVANDCRDRRLDTPAYKTTAVAIERRTRSVER
jgi:hypothetical protein